MNVEAYTLDSLRKLVRELQEENRILRELLKEKNIEISAYTTVEKKEKEPDEYDPDQGARILPVPVEKDTANMFLGRFWGRKDVYAKRASKGGYFPQCANFWKAICHKKSDKRFDCEKCEHKRWKPISLEIVMQHMRGRKEDGSDAIGVYPLWTDNTCRFLVFDFDNHEKGAEGTDFANTNSVWKDEVNALRKICHLNKIPALVERSRSGRGAHVWIFFASNIPAVLARHFGLTLLDRGAEMINLSSFRFYDRMYPSQDVSSYLGNLIALPWQGQALKQGNSAFVDEYWNAYPDQWEALMGTQKLSLEAIQRCLQEWVQEMTGQALILSSLLKQERLKPWKRNDGFHLEDVSGTMHIVLADGLYVDALNIMPRTQNVIRCMATIDNPQYYKNQKSGRSNYYTFSVISLAKNVDGYVKIPRGLLDAVEEKCKKSGIAYEIQDKRRTGRPIRVTFKGELREHQKLAVKNLLKFDMGILNAATGSGKTVVSSYLIASKKVSTLILVASTDLIPQWKDELEKFLDIDEAFPFYMTPKGKEKRRDSIIGTLSGGQDKTGGIVDIAMIGSAYKQGNFMERIDEYGLVIMDECHHAASAQAAAVLQRIQAKYVYGVSATPMRSDRLEKINYMLLGPIRHVYSAREQAESLKIRLFVYPRFTRVVHLGEEELSYQASIEKLCDNEDRNSQIINDIRACVTNGRTPVILSGRKAHAKYLYESLKTAADHVYLMYGDNKAEENQRIRVEMSKVSKSESIILVATGQKIGEGFNLPRLDTMMLASPIKFDGRLTQYAGRLAREYVGKQKVIIYDYVDSHIKLFEKQYRSRLAAYKRMGYQIISNAAAEKQEVQAIYDSGNYTETFERDLVEADKEIVISSPKLVNSKVYRMLELIKKRQEAGVQVTIITMNPQNVKFGDTDEMEQMIIDMRKAGLEVRLTDDETEHFAVFDRKLVWHGGMNLLGKQDVWDNLIRTTDYKAAAELIELAFLDVQRS